ncbi:MAG: DNA topoisomerase 3 [Sphaerochaetaceae bacterium]
MKQLVLAEKPSVGREIARVLTCSHREQGYIEGANYIVTWALGHLIELAQPAAYDSRYKRWSLDTLPMLPKELKREVIEQSSAQFSVIAALVGRADIETVVIATDAGREGELVARWILLQAGWKGPMKRLWISSQTDTAIMYGFEQLKDSALYDNLYKAAQARAAADWYVGLNVTRALTCRYDAKLSAGRVQTPTLALLARCEDDIDAFTGSFYWTLRADFGSFMASWHDSDGSLRITDEGKADAIIARVEGKKGRVVLVENMEKSEQPPLAYDLTELQRDANRLLAFSAKQTLDTLQRLYEIHKIVTYPRTDSRYITNDIVATLPARLVALERTPLSSIAGSYSKNGFRVDEQRFVQESKVTDHHAILPTEQHVDLDRLNSDERALWELVAVRFLEVLSQDYLYSSMKIEIEVEGETFSTHVTKPLCQGWRDIARLAGLKRNTIVEEDITPSFTAPKEQDEIMLESVGKRRNTTPAPERFTEATLLSAMEHPGRYVDDPSLKKHLGGGLGTPATRADIIEKLIQNHYVERDGKYLTATPKGRELVRLAPRLLQSPELTAVWEDRLSSIAEGSESDIDFIRDITQTAAQLVRTVKESREQFAPKFPEGRTCTYCNAPMMRFVDDIGRDHYVCQRLSCSYEEMIVRKKATASDVKKATVVHAKPTESNAQAKKVVVVKKTVSKKAIEPQWETTIEVVNPSKFQRFSRVREDNQPLYKEAYRSDQKDTFTIADMIAASKKKKDTR